MPLLKERSWLGVCFHRCAIVFVLLKQHFIGVHFESEGCSGVRALLLWCAYHVYLSVY